MTEVPAPRGQGAAGGARGVLRLGAGVAAALIVFLRYGAGLPWAQASGLALFLALLPAAAVAQLRAVKGSEHELPRLQVYASSAVTGVVLALVALGLSRLDGGRPLGFAVTPLGDGPPTPFRPSLVAWTAGLVLAGLAVTLAFKHLSAALGLGEDPLLRAILPRTARERRAFAGLSVSAGFGEEMAYRGYVIPMLAPMLGVGGAVAVSSGVFGLMHAYQGWVGVARTALMGGVMAGGYLMSGSLWPPVVAHAIFDVLAGIVLADHLMAPDPPGRPGFEGESAAPNGAGSGDGDPRRDPEGVEGVHEHGR